MTTETPTRTVATVHYNTPEMTEAMIRSLWKQSGRQWRVVVLDNSDSRPLPPMEGVEIIDNTRGQQIDFGAQLAQWPKRNFKQGAWMGCNFGSVKHMLSVDWLMDYIGAPFILCDSDILLRQDAALMWHPEATAAGQTEKAWGNPGAATRLLPFLCFINAPECRRLGIRYHDPARSFALGVDKDWYDTGASFLEDIREAKAQGAVLVSIGIGDKMVHFGNGSWKKNGLQAQSVWLKEYEYLWDENVTQQTQYFAVIGDRDKPLKTVIMVHIKATTRDGRQFHLEAEPGYVLRSKVTGKEYRTTETLDLRRWEAVPEKQPSDTTGESKPQTAKRAKRKAK